MRHLYIFRHQYVAGKTKSHNGFHIHKEKTLWLVDITNEFVFGSGDRLKQFGKFTDVGLCLKNVPLKSYMVYVIETIIYIHIYIYIYIYIYILYENTSVV